MRVQIPSRVGADPRRVKMDRGVESAFGEAGVGKCSNLKHVKPRGFRSVAFVAGNGLQACVTLRLRSGGLGGSTRYLHEISCPVDSTR
jgi:hypothetical protein